MNRRGVHLILLSILLLLAVLLYLSMDRAAADTSLSLEQGRQMVHQYLQIGETAQAETLARQLMSERDNPTSLACLLAEVLLADQRASEAVALLKPIRDAQAGGEVCEMLGKALIADNRGAAGQRELETALSIDPQRMGAIAALSQLYLAQQREDDAARWLLPHADEPRLQPMLAALAISRYDPALLARFLQPLDAATVGCILAMLCDNDDWLSRLSPPDCSTPWSMLARAWREQPNRDATRTLLTLALDQLDDPLASAQPLPRVHDEPTRLWQLARQRWPAERMWDELVIEPQPQPDVAVEIGSAALIAQVLNLDAAPRQWDAAMNLLIEQIGPQASSVVLDRSTRSGALASTWRARVALAQNDRDEAKRWIELAAAECPRSPRVLRIMGELAPTSARLD
ncbi:MAG: hypothetical protein IT445_08740 [Phycisphaeraceae bacterium]|nr:hypothetical protein [Phycisphaeraceae bacterium]